MRIGGIAIGTSRPQKVEIKIVKEAILASLKSAKLGLTFEELVQQVRQRIGGESGKAKNLTVSQIREAQAELERQSMIEPVDKAFRIKLPSGKLQTLRQVYHIKTTPGVVWQMLVDPKLIKEWSGSPAVMSGKVGLKFSLWEDTIKGKNIEVVPAKKLTQEWQEPDWKEPSIATFRLAKDSHGGTTLVLVQERIPRSKAKDIADGWEEYYLGVIKRKFDK